MKNSVSFTEFFVCVLGQISKGYILIFIIGKCKKNLHKNEKEY